jgi:HEAT repeat protein
MKKIKIFIILAIFVIRSDGRAADKTIRINNLRQRIEMGSINPALPELLSLAEPKNGTAVIVRANALAALGEVVTFVPEDTRKKIVTVMIASCGDESDEIRRASYRALSKFSKRDEIPDDIIVAGLREQNTDVAAFAADLVLKTKQYSGAVVETLVAIVNLGREDPGLETAPVIRALAAMPAITDQVINSLYGALQARDPLVMSEAALAIARLKGMDARLTEALTELMRRPNYLVRLHVLDAIAMIADVRHNADLMKLLYRGASDSNPAVRMRADDILEKLSGTKHLNH